MSQPPTIVAFGYHDQQSPRHWSVCRALRKEGQEIIECHTEARGLMGKYRDLWKKYRKREAGSGKREAVLVTFPGHYLVPLAWLLSRFPRKKLIFDAFISLYDTNVCDRGRASRRHPRAWLWYFVDLVSCHLADEILIDTEEHKKYFANTFRLNPKSLHVVYLESRPDLFFPKPTTYNLPFGLELRAERQPTTSFNILFYGSYIPLHGIDIIVGAARLLASPHPKIHFTLVGKGQTYQTMRALAAKDHLRSVTFLDPVPYEQLPNLLHSADLCLGIFGGTPKAQRVIPHKVYDAVACGIPIITADSPAVRERFAHHPLVTLCPPGNPQSLAEAILRYVSIWVEEQCLSHKRSIPSLIG